MEGTAQTYLQGGSTIMLLIARKSYSSLLDMRAAVELVDETLNVTGRGWNWIGLLYRVQPKPDQQLPDFWKEVEVLMEAADIIEWF